MKIQQNGIIKKNKTSSIGRLIILNPETKFSLNPHTLYFVKNISHTTKGNEANIVALKRDEKFLLNSILLSNDRAAGIIRDSNNIL